MKLVFRLAYSTVNGESLWLEYGIRDCGTVKKETLPMIWEDAGHWVIQVGLEVPEGAALEYRYVLRRDDGLELKEWGEMRCCCLVPESTLTFLDDWRSAGSDDYIYESKVFEVVDATQSKRELSGVSWSVNHEFNLLMTRLPEGTVPCVIGGIDALGDWDFSKALPMVEVSKNRWQVGVDLPMDWQVEYKYGLYSSSEGMAISLEVGAENRALPRRGRSGFVKISDECFRRSVDMNFRAAGVAIPVFSLRSEVGCGVGEFLDLKPMAEWAASAGMKMLQILPINDTTSSRTWTDSYPYSAISVYALHPLYLRVDEMSYSLVDHDAFQGAKTLLNRSKKLDYEAVMDVKWQITREVFNKNFKAISKDKNFLRFLDRNRDWVIDYAVFSVKRDEFETADFSKWSDWSVYASEKVEALSNDPEVLYFVWLQYELDRQLCMVVSDLRALGVVLKGDLPIGVDRESVDAWAAPHLFKMDAQTGAPPDGFAAKGQNWGFPTYDWYEMKKDGYAWWRSRFEKLSRYFDAYRIDHILGFFRIWQIPLEHVDGIMGWFDPALPVRLEEFEERGVPFERARFCEAFVDDDLLREVFGEFADGVRQDFFEESAPGGYRFKQRFTTQRGILDFFAKLTPGDWANQDWLRDALVELVSEVLFFEVEGSKGTEFHPRMEMQKTRSFHALEQSVQQKLNALYTDYFYNRQEVFWEAKAYEKLPAMRGASDMLLCGEDLGMVPECVPGVMRQLGMLELIIQRWPKTGEADFYDLTSAPYLSVVSTGTHDMPTLRSWWREDEQVRAKFSWDKFGIALPEKELSGGMAQRIIEQHLDSPAMWAVFPLQDLLAMDDDQRSNDIEGERINVPAITPFYWRWRMEMDVEELSARNGFQQMLANLVSGSGR